MHRLPGVVAVVALAAGLTACSTENERESWRDAPAASGASEPTAAGTGTAEPAEQLLELTTSTIESDSCVSAPERDYAWFEVEWKALADLEGFAFELVDPVGVRQVGDGLVVPPVNVGGRIDYSGSVTWETRAEIGRTREVSWSERDPVWSWVPIEGQTGLLVLHLRFDGTPASLGGVRATWTTEDGQTGETVVDVPHRWTFVDDPADCP